MNFINDLLEELTARLPELAWKLGKLNPSVSRFRLPHGLFRAAYEPGGVACINEIKSDIQVLIKQKQSPGALYLAERIQRKVSVLVSLCHLEGKGSHTQEKVRFGLTSLSTRQQWIVSLEQEIDQLVIQQNAVHHSLEQKKHNASTELLLSLQSELGQIEKRLTLLKEDLKKATL